jgi:hypothetical protein
MVEFILFGSAMISTAMTAAFLNQRGLVCLPNRGRRRNSSQR